MAAIARIDPKSIFSPQEWAELTRRRPWDGPLLIAHAWGLIALAWAVYALWPNPLTLILGVMIVGARQLGLAILMHEAAHGALSKSLRLNDWLGEWLCAAPVGASLALYRPYHLKHHKYAEQPEDPDLVLSRPFPVTRASLWRKILRDLTGQTFLKQRFGPLLAPRAPGSGDPAVVKARRAAGARFVVVNAALAGGLSLAGQWQLYVFLWLLPMATWFPLVTRLRNIAEHACLKNPADPFGLARTTTANPLERLLIAPYWVHYHAEHHVFMHLPCRALPKVHKRLIEKGFGERIETAPGYLSVLRTATTV